MRLPDGWPTLALGDGMSESSDLGRLAFLRAPRDPKQPHTAELLAAQAIIIIAEHGAIHDSLMDYGAGRYLGISAGTSAEWGTARPSTIGGTPVELVEGKGKVGRDPAQLWQVRRKHPHATSKGQGYTVFILGVLRLPASDETRRVFEAALGSLVVK